MDKINQQRSSSYIREQLDFQCNICTLQYDVYDREPIAICSNNHANCKQCVANFLFRNQLEYCPICKQIITRQKIRNLPAHILIKKISSLMPNVRKKDDYFSQKLKNSQKKREQTQNKLQQLSKNNSQLVNKLEITQKYLAISEESLQNQKNKNIQLEQKLLNTQTKLIKYQEQVKYLLLQIYKSSLKLQCLIINKHQFVDKLQTTYQLYKQRKISRHLLKIKQEQIQNLQFNKDNYIQKQKQAQQISQYLTTKLNQNVEKLEMNEIQLKIYQENLLLYQQKINLLNQNSMRNSEKLISDHQASKLQLMNKLSSLQHQNHQLKDELNRCIDKQAQDLIVQLTAQLQNQKTQNRRNSQTIELMQKDIRQCERQLMQKNQRIKYLGLVLSCQKKQFTEKEQHITNLELSNNSLQQKQKEAQTKLYNLTKINSQIANKLVMTQNALHIYQGKLPYYQKVNNQLRQKLSNTQNKLMEHQQTIKDIQLRKVDFDLKQKQSLEKLQFLTKINNQLINKLEITQKQLKTAQLKWRNQKKANIFLQQTRLMTKKQQQMNLQNKKMIKPNKQSQDKKKQKLPQYQEHLPLQIRKKHKLYNQQHNGQVNLIKLIAKPNQFQLDSTSNKFVKMKQQKEIDSLKKQQTNEQFTQKQKQININPQSISPHKLKQQPQLSLEKQGQIKQQSSQVKYFKSVLLLMQTLDKATQTWLPAEKYGEVLLKILQGGKKKNDNSQS